MATNDGEVAGVVFGWVFLFVGWLVFFVYDDESGVFDGGEDGRSGTNDDACFSKADALPFVEALALREVGVEDCNLIGEFVEARLEALDGLGSEGDFRDEDDDVFAEVEGGLSGLEVDFSFAGAGDAVEEDGTRLFAVEAFDDGVVNFGLLVVEFEWFGGDESFVSIGVASYFEVGDFNPAFFGHRFERGSGGGAS